MSQGRFVEGLEQRTLFAATTPTFAPPVRYITGESAHSVAFGDFRHTGLQDMAVASPEDNSITVFLNQGNGTFVQEPKLRFAHPVQVVAGDFNGDGNLDLAVLTTSIPARSINLAGNRTTTDALVLFIGDGRGNFTQGQGFRVIVGNHHMIEGDFNGDGRPDLAITTSHGVGVLLNTGNGSFAPEVPYATSANDIASYVVAGDFNGDGKPDLAVAMGSLKAVRILLNNGNGSFTVAKAYHVPGNAVSIAVGDFQNNGKLDLAVVGNGYRQGLRLLLGNGDGTFTLGPISAVGAFLQSVAVGDFNGDGTLDLAAIDFTSSVRVATGQGNGLFSSFAILPGGTESYVVSPVDLTNDGKLDLVVLRHDSIYVYLNTTP